MKGEKVTKKVARTLSESLSIGDLSEEIEKIDALKSLLEKSKELKRFFVNPIFTFEEKSDIIIFLSEKTGLRDATKKILLTLLKNNAFMALPVFLRHLKKFYSEKRRLIKANVISSIDLDSRYIERIRSSLKSLTNMEVEVDVTIDESILGGVVIRFDNTIYDLSLRGQLNILKNEIIKG